MALRRRSRVLAAGVLAAAVVAGATVVARGDPGLDLPAIGAAELIASVIDRPGDPVPVSGLLASHVDMGLPSIPAGGPASEDPILRAMDAVNGDRRVRLWASKDGVRLALLLPTSELGLFLSRHGDQTEAWAWDSQTFTAIHAGPTPSHDLAATPGPAAVAGLVDPLELARRSLQALAPSTRVEVGESLRVAGRDAYRLVVEPRTEATLVGRIEIGVDAEHRVPLRVAVTARGADSPALSVEFSSISFTPIAPSTFRFTPPEGAVVREIAGIPKGSVDQPPPRSDRSGPGPLDPGGEPVRILGRGWEAVLAVQVPARSVTELDELAGLLPFSGSLFSLRLVERAGHGWLLAGSVPQTRLASVERTLP
jgi:hypothetical protein